MSRCKICIRYCCRKGCLRAVTYKFPPPPPWAVCSESAGFITGSTQCTFYYLLRKQVRVSPNYFQWDSLWVQNNQCQVSGSSTTPDWAVCSDVGLMWWLLGSWWLCRRWLTLFPVLRPQMPEGCMQTIIKQHNSWQTSRSPLSSRDLSS